MSEKMGGEDLNPEATKSEAKQEARRQRYLANKGNAKTIGLACTLCSSAPGENKQCKQWEEVEAGGARGGPYCKNCGHEGKYHPEWLAMNGGKRRRTNKRRITNKRRRTNKKRRVRK